MDSAELKSIQAPIKERYREQPETAVITLRAEGRLGEDVSLLGANWPCAG